MLEVKVPFIHLKCLQAMPWDSEVHWPVTGCACSELDRDGEAGVSQSWKPVSKTIRKS